MLAYPEAARSASGAETDEAQSHRQLDMFIEAGGTLIDTADAYTNGESEAIIGRWLGNRSRSDDIIVATKGRFNPPPGFAGASRRGLVHSVDNSLGRLGVDQDAPPSGPTRLEDDPGRGVGAHDARNTDRTWQITEVAQRIADAHIDLVGHRPMGWRVHPRYGSISNG